MILCSYPGVKNNTFTELMNLQVGISIFLYISATGLLAQNLYGLTGSNAFIKSLINGCGFVALLFHADLLYSSIIIDNGLALGFFNAVSLLSWMVALIVLLASFSKPLENLLLIFYPLAVISILLAWFIPGGRILTDTDSIGLKIHIIISVCAYSLLMIGAFQAITLAIQEKMIKAKRAAVVMNILPPLQIMENLLVQLIVAGFFLLSLSLASGMMFISDLFAQHLVHKTVLSISAWLIYGILLWGRWSVGWRGQKIIRWAIGGFIALLLAYIGSKFVLELILHRV